MKLSLCFLFAWIFISPIFSQPTITSDWFYSIGDTMLATGHFVDTSLEPMEGMNILWDISGEAAPSNETETIWVPAAELSYVDEFPNATIGYARDWGGEFFFSNTNGIFQEVGFRSSTSKVEYEAEGPLWACDNFSFNDIKVREFTSIRTSFVSGLTTTEDIRDELTFAGFGTVITPLGTYENCVMTKLVRTGTTPNNNSIEYRFYKDNLSNFIASYAYSPVNIEPTRRISYKIEQLTTDIKELPKPSLELERVAENSLFLKASKPMDRKIQIFDLAGQLMLEESKSISIGSNEIKIDVLTPTNIYFLFIFDENSQSFQTIKFLKK